MKRTKTIRVRVRTLKEAQDFISKEIPRQYRGIYAEAVAGNLVIELRKQPPYKYVSRFAAYGMQKGGPGFFSDKQRRFVMARLRDGRFDPGVPHRTGQTTGRPGQPIRSGPGFHVENKGAKAVIVNTEPGARWTVNDGWQARQPALVGWQKTSVTIADNIDKAMVDAIDNVTEAIAKKG